MVESRWWHLAVVGTTIVLTATLLIGQPSAERRVGALLALAVFLVAWFAFGRRSGEGDARALAFTAVIVLVAGVATGFSPSMATFQAVGYPLVWIIASSLRAAIVADVALALSVGVGMLFSLGTEPDALVQIAFTVGLSLVFSLALGLWIARIVELSLERQALIDELTEAQGQVAALNRDAGITSERERLARELHDTIAQNLTGLVMLSQRARRELAAGSLTDESLELMEDAARDALVETRSLVAAGAPVELSGGGIAEALERLAARFSRETGITVSARSELQAGLERDTEVVLLRCAQEGLANVRKHSGATHARIELTGTEGDVSLTVADDGRGFDASATTIGFGLSGLRHRLALVGGELTVTSDAGGTVLGARLSAARS